MAISNFERIIVGCVDHLVASHDAGYRKRLGNWYRDRAMGRGEVGLDAQIALGAFPPLQRRKLTGNLIELINIHNQVDNILNGKERE